MMPPFFLYACLNAVIRDGARAPANALFPCFFGFKIIDVLMRFKN
jgi:hypothetical protein